MYEILYIVPAPFTEKDLPNISKKVKKLIEGNGGKIIKEEGLGNKKLAYPIKQVYRGFYNLVHFEIEPEKVKELDKKIKLTPEILRHLIVRVEIRSAPKKKPRRPPEKKAMFEEELKEPKEKKIIPEEKPRLEAGPPLAKEEKPKEKPKKKIDLKKLGEKIDELFKI